MMGPHDQKMCHALPPGPNNLEVEKAYDKLREQAERTLRHSAYSVVDLGNLFQPLLSFKMSEDSTKSWGISVSLL